MAKYKVGDVVKVREDLKLDDYYGSIQCLPQHMINRGEAHTITDVSRDGNYCLDNEYYYSEEMLEEVIPQHICCDSDKWLSAYDKYIRGLWDKKDDIVGLWDKKDDKEEKEMNKVVDLWFERKQKKIVDKYNKLEKEHIESIEIVKKYNELIDKFNKNLEELYKEDSVNEYQVLEEYDDETEFKYILDTGALHFEASKEYIDKKQEELNTLKDTKDEVEALLSLSDDLEYQEEVLTRYNIITKKTKKISE